MYAAQPTFLPGSREKCRENALATMVWMDHARQFFLFCAMMIQYQVTDKCALFIIEKIIGDAVVRRTKLDPAYAHG